MSHGLPTIESFTGLTRTERALLEALLAHPHGRASLSDLALAGWGNPDPHAMSHACLAVHICGLRRKVAPHRILCTRPGYQFVPAAPDAA